MEKAGVAPEGSTVVLDLLANDWLNQSQTPFGFVRWYWYVYQAYPGMGDREKQTAATCLWENRMYGGANRQAFAQATETYLALKPWNWDREKPAWYPYMLGKLLSMNGIDGADWLYGEPPFYIESLNQFLAIIQWEKGYASKIQELPDWMSERIEEPKEEDSDER